MAAGYISNIADAVHVLVLRHLK